MKTYQSVEKRQLSKRNGAAMAGEIVAAQKSASVTHRRISIALCAAAASRGAQRQSEHQRKRKYQAAKQLSAMQQPMKEGGDWLAKKKAGVAYRRMLAVAKYHRESWRRKYQ
jgi:hypothetical protein